MSKKAGTRWLAVLQSIGLGLALLLNTQRSFAEDGQVAKIARQNEALLKTFYDDRVPVIGTTFIRISCSIFDRYVDFTSGCRWLLSWEANIGKRLGQGLEFLKEKDPNPRSLNFAFAIKPFEEITLNSKKISQRKLFEGCDYVVYDVDGKKFHYAYIVYDKNRRGASYNRCITRSIIEYLDYSKNYHIENEGFNLYLLLLTMKIAPSADFDSEMANAIQVVEKIAAWER